MKVIKVQDEITEIKGKVHIQVWRGIPKRVGSEWIGDLKDERTIENIVVTKGKQLILKLLARKLGITGLEVIAIGIGTTGEVVGDTSLETEKARENITFTSTITGAETTMTYSAFFDTESPGTTEDISEVGLFGNGATLVVDSGDLFTRKTFTGIEKEVGIDTLTVDYNLSF